MCCEEAGNFIVQRASRRSYRFAEVEIDCPVFKNEIDIIFTAGIDTAVSCGVHFTGKGERISCYNCAVYIDVIVVTVIDIDHFSVQRVVGDSTVYGISRSWLFRTGGKNQ